MAEKMTAPPWLDRRAKKLWAQHLEELGDLVEERDRTALALLCSLEARIERLSKQIAQEGETLCRIGERGEIVYTNPAVGILRDCTRQAVELQKQLTLTPVSRRLMPQKQDTKPPKKEPEKHDLNYFRAPNRRQKPVN